MSGTRAGALKGWETRRLMHRPTKRNDAREAEIERRYKEYHRLADRAAVLGRTMSRAKPTRYYPGERHRPEYARYNKAEAAFDRAERRAQAARKHYEAAL